jgi:hypothetical protein
MTSEEFKKEFQSIVEQLRSAFDEWLAAKEQQSGQVANVGWSGQYGDADNFLNHLREEETRLLTETDSTQEQIISTEAAMEDVQFDQRLQDMKSVWDKLRAEGVPIDKRPLDGNIPWSIQFEFQAKSDPTGKDQEWWKANRSRFLSAESCRSDPMDDGQTAETQGPKYPWEDVEAARRNPRLQAQHHSAEARAHYKSQAKPCPKCLTPPDQLAWFYFESPPETWAHLCGVAGWITVCDSCHLQVDFFTDILS